MENHRRVGFCSNSSDRNLAFAIFLRGFTQIIVRSAGGHESFRRLFEQIRFRESHWGVHRREARLGVALNFLLRPQTHANIQTNGEDMTTTRIMGFK